MKLDTSHLRYLSDNDLRVLTAVETGSRNHLVVPTPLITQIAKLRSGNASRSISELAKTGLISRLRNAKYDGYRLTYHGYDSLALKAFSKKGTIYSVGPQVGTGKESDVFTCTADDESGKKLILKVHRLGRISFRTVKQNRDYLQGQKSASWMYLSRLAAEKEFEFMKILHDNGFPVPQPIDQNRHQVVMEFIDAFPLRQIEEIADPASLYSALMQLIVRLASQGLIHGDYNEFNILVYEDGRPILIDFPQMISIDHPNARDYFERDVECIKTYFLKKYRFEADEAPQWEDVERIGKLDHEVKASGYGGKLGKQMEWFHREVSAVTNNQRGDNNAEDTDSDEEEEDEEDEEAEEEIVESEEGDEDSDRGNYEEDEGEEERGKEREEEGEKQGRNRS